MSERASAALPPRDLPCSLTRLRERWPELVGAQIGSVCEPLRMQRDGTLELRALTDAWADELIAMEPELLATLPPSVDGVSVCGVFLQLVWRDGRADDMGDDPAEAWKR